MRMVEQSQGDVETLSSGDGETRRRGLPSGAVARACKTAGEGGRESARARDAANARRA